MSYPSDLELSNDDRDPTLLESDNRGTNRFKLVMGIGERELSPGVIDRAAIDAFTMGHCHSFALAVCDLIPGAYPVETAGGGHVLAVLPDGGALDIEGWSEEEWAHDYRDRGPNDWMDDCYKLPRAADALPFAETLLRDLDISF